MSFTLQLLLLITTTAVLTAAMTCKNMVWDASSNVGNMALTDDVMETGRYMVRTTKRINSTEVKDLISKLNGASEIQYKRKSFTAVLQPKDIKKLCHNSHLVRSIKEVKKISNTQTHSCDKLKKGDPKFVIPSSYIVMIKPYNNMSQMAPLIITASNDLDSSVMISSVREFHNPNRRGATLKMNTEGVQFMCNQSVVDYIEEDQEVTMTSPTSPWHLDRIDQPDLPLDGEYSSPNDGSGVDIYVFDTGIKYDHDEFEGRAKYDYYDPVDTAYNTNQLGMDCHGHGTHVAALAAGKTYGVAKGATVYSMRVLSCSGQGSFVDVLLGINHVIGQQIANRDRRIIINMSLRGPFSQAVDDAIRDATNEGILVVVAAGNDFTDACKFSPGASSYALTVGGTQQNDDLYLRLFDGTNYGKCVDIFAPGQEILSAGIRGKDAVERFSGTSQAAPLVSGAAAIYWNMKGDAKPLDIKNTITSTCTRDKLKISAVVPNGFQQQTPNCLLFIGNRANFTHRDMNNSNVPYQIFYSVPPSLVETSIRNLENRSYALTYIHSHSINSVIYYNLVFKYMGDEFITIISPRLKNVKRSINTYKANGYQPTFIYNKVDSIDYIAVLEKTNLDHSIKYRLTKDKHDNEYQTKSSQGDSLLSTTVALDSKDKIRYTSIYVHDSVKTHHLSSVNISELLEALNMQLNQGFYLSHLTTIHTDPPSYAVVFHKMTKPANYYVMSTDLKIDQVDKFVQMQISNGFTPLVVARLDTPNGAKIVVSFEQ